MSGVRLRCAPDIRPACHAGRPRTLDVNTRREAILDAASTVLQEHGFHAASMDRVAKTACMSKKTLYQWFDSKSILYETLIAERLLTIRTQLPPEPGPIDVTLSRLLKALMREFMRPERISLLRAVISEGDMPEIRQIVFELFQMKFADSPVRRLLAEQRDLGVITCDDIGETSDLLFGMTIGLITLQELTGCRPMRPDAEQDSVVDCGVQIFLRGIERPRTDT